MSEVVHLDVEDLLGLVRLLRAGPVRDVGLLDAAAHRPRSSAFGQDAYPTVPLKAAALLHSLVGNHALVDGNERLGWLATTVFLDINGYRTGTRRRPRLRARHGGRSDGPRRKCDRGATGRPRGRERLLSVT